MSLIAATKAALNSWLELERDKAALWLPVFMGAGIMAYYALRSEPSVWLGSALALPAMGLAIWVPAGRWLLGPIAAVVLGFASAQLSTARAPPIETDLPSRATIITGSVKVVEVLPNGRRITIQPAWLDGAADPLLRSVRVRLQKKDDGPLTSGDSIRIRALVRPPAPPSYPGGWDLQRDAFYAGLGASGYALGKAERTAKAAPSAPMQFVEWLRELIAGRITGAIPGVAGPVSVTMLIGGSGAISEADWSAFRDSGLAHLLSVSGSNMVIVVGCVLVVFRCAFALSERASLFWPVKKLSMLCALVAAAGYMVLCGMQVPIVRSFIMVCLISVALLADRRPFSLRGLAVAATVLFLVAPQVLPGASFQMSFSAVLALIAGYEALRPWLLRLRGETWPRRLVYYILLLALSSALAGTAAAPFGAYHFGRVQVYYVLANMIAVPLATFAVPAGLIAMVLMPLHLEALALVPMGWAAEGILWIARVTAALPVATLNVPHMPIWGLCMFSFGLIWLGVWQTRRRLAGIVIMLVGLASPLADRPPDLLVSADGRLIAVQTPQGAFLQQTQGGSKFTRDAWAHYWGIDSFQAMPRDGAGVSLATPSHSGTGVPWTGVSAAAFAADAGRTGPNSAPKPASSAASDPDSAAGAGIDAADKQRHGAGAEGIVPTSSQTSIIRCELGACLLQPYPDRPGALLVRGALHPKFCDQSSIVVSAEPARGSCPRPWPALVDRFTVWRYGSAAIWLDRDGARFLTDRTERGTRPWVPPPPKPKQAAAPKLPLAAVDRPEAAEREEQAGPAPDVPPPDLATD